VFLGRLVGTCGEIIGVVRFDGLCVCVCVFVMFVGLEFNNVSGLIRGDGVTYVSKYLDSAFLSLDSL